MRSGRPGPRSRPSVRDDGALGGEGDLSVGSGCAPPVEGPASVMRGGCTCSRGLCFPRASDAHARQVPPSPRTFHAHDSLLCCDGRVSTASRAPSLRGVGIGAFLRCFPPDTLGSRTPGGGCRGESEASGRSRPRGVPSPHGPLCAHRPTLPLSPRRRCWPQLAAFAKPPFTNSVLPELSLACPGAGRSGEARGHTAHSLSERPKPQNLDSRERRHLRTGSPMTSTADVSSKRRVGRQ